MTAPPAGTYRQTVCYVLRRNGAWLISWGGPLTQDSPPDELYDCAGSLGEAKRLGRQGALDFGYTNLSTRWQREENGDLWSLNGEGEW